MITEISIENFKCFRNLRLSLAPLTLFTGFNGGGKSSAIQPLLLLSQGFRLGPDPRSFALNGPLVSLGTTMDVIRPDPSETALNPVFAVGSGGVHRSWKFEVRANTRSLRVTQTVKSPRKHLGVEDPVSQLQKLSYLSAVRQGSSEVYPVPDSDDGLVADVGTDGRFAAFLYDRAVDDEVIEARRHPNEPATSFRKQFDAWFSSLFPEARANARKLPPVEQLCLEFQLSDVSAWRRPANVGFGLGYVFPILVALLAAQEGQILIIDSPEAHLHPFAQSQMGRMLAKFASAGVQILVETHSDHLLNGVRLAIKDKVLANKDAKIHFFTGAGPETHGVISPLLDAVGNVSEWPEGFFDQADKDLSSLTDWG
jgi:predicted ATPase